MSQKTAENPFPKNFQLDPELALDTIIVTTNDGEAQAMRFTDEADLCNFWWDIQDGIDSEQIIVFEPMVVCPEHGTVIRCVSHPDKCWCDDMTITQALDKFFNGSEESELH